MLGEEAGVQGGPGKPALSVRRHVGQLDREVVERQCCVGQLRQIPGAAAEVG